MSRSSAALLYFPVVKGAATSQFILRAIREAPMTLAMAERLGGVASTLRADEPAAAAECDRLSRRLRTCATARDGWRCGAFICPRCAVRASKPYRKRVERLLGVPLPLAFVTLTAIHRNLRSALTALKAAFARIRRRTAWRGLIKGGVASIEVQRSDRRALWNAHLHAVVVLASTELVGVEPLSETWRMLLARAETTGALDIRRVTRRFVAHRFGFGR